jgi:hypothetical protein
VARGLGLIQRNQKYGERDGKKEMLIDDSKVGLVKATTGSKVSALEYYKVGEHGTIAGEWVIHEYAPTPQAMAAP